MDMLKEAGWPVWLVLVLGTFSVVQAVRYRVGSAGGGEVVGAVAAALLAGL